MNIARLAEDCGIASLAVGGVGIAMAVRGYLTRKPVWLMAELSIETVRQQVWEMERGAYHFYLEAAKQVNDAEVRKLLAQIDELGLAVE